jgi:hypothetical protein
VLQIAAVAFASLIGSPTVMATGNPAGFSQRLRISNLPRDAVALKYAQLAAALEPRGARLATVTIHANRVYYKSSLRMITLPTFFSTLAVA